MRLATTWYDKHRSALRAAREACRTRGHFSLFAETPDRHPAGVEGAAVGRAAFESLLGRRFEIDQPGTIGYTSGEISPYTGAPLGIEYPLAEIDVLFNAARRSMPAWAAAGARARLGVCMEVIDRLHARVFESAQAVMHTAGQSALMSYAGSGTNALDRGVEALAYAAAAMEDVPSTALWERRFGSANIALRKKYTLVPRGVAVCFTCATFPTWNAYPAMLANLATGNPVIVKPHPSGILPMAIAVRVFRECLSEAGFSPDLVTLCPDTPMQPLGKILVKHRHTAIVDFTGSATFGAWVEGNAAPALCYTETSGVNTVVIDSVDELEPVVRSLATTMSLFSAQMCTSPQNIYIPADGIRCGAKKIGRDEFSSALVDAMRAIASDPKRAAPILAAIQSPATLALVEQMRAQGAKAGRVLLEPGSYQHPDFPQARTCTPLLLEVPCGRNALYGQERFGPIGFLIPTEAGDAALIEAAQDARQGGAITAFAYSTDDAWVSRAEEAFSAAGAQLTVNLTGPMPLNFAAAYSDYHVTGLNPAGNATLTDAAFVTSRFRITQSRRFDAKSMQRPNN